MGVWWLCVCVCAKIDCIVRQQHSLSQSSATATNSAIHHPLPAHNNLPRQPASARDNFRGGIDETPVVDAETIRTFKTADRRENGGGGADLQLRSTQHHAAGERT